MASELRVNTLKDASGNNSIGMSYVAEGTAKAWLNFTGVTTTASRDSFNISSLTDAGTGQTNPISFTNNMSNTNYSGSYFQNAVTGTNYNSFDNQHAGGFGSFTTSSFGAYSFSTTSVDAGLNLNVIVGDLA